MTTPPPPARPQPIVITVPPCRADFDTVTFYWHDTQLPNGNPAPLIESARKRYELKDWNSDLMEVTYQRAADTIQTPPEKDPKTMTTPTQPQPADKVSAAELRAAFEGLHCDIADLNTRIESIAEELNAIRSALASAATRPQQAASAAPTGPTVDFMAEEISYSMDEAGHPVYKLRGGRFTKFGVRVWPEILPALGIDSKTLLPGANLLPALRVRAELTESGQPRKVIGLA